MNEYKVHTVSHLHDGKNHVQYHQVVSPSGKVIYDHMPTRQGALHFCAFLNRGLTEIQAKHEPLVKQVKEMIFLLRDENTSFVQVADLISKLEQTITALEA